MSNCSLLKSEDEGGILHVLYAAGLSGRLVREEDMEHGAVTARTYLTYCRAAGGFLLCILVVISFAVPVICSAFTNWWLSEWILFVRTRSTVHSL